MQLPIRTYQLEQVEQVERGQRLRHKLVVARERPVTLDGTQQHRHAVSFVSLVRDSGRLVDQDLQRFGPQVRVQGPRLVAAQDVPAICPGDADPGATGPAARSSSSNNAGGRWRTLSEARRRGRGASVSKPSAVRARARDSSSRRSSKPRQCSASASSPLAG
ncbi:MAG: hypothetical protein M3069_28905 [Chloroflexota bacterium]|nr:hypothetical protein [Chloroflexota bacterium]